MPDSPTLDNTCALVLAAHGSQTEPRAALDIHTHVERLRALGLFNEVRAAFWKELPSWRTATLGLRSEHVIVVPMLMSAGYFAERVLPRELARSSELSGVQVTHTQPVGTHPDLQRAALAAVEEKIATFDAKEEVTVIIAGHGTTRHAQSKQSILDVVELVRTRHPEVPTHALFLDESPRLDTFGELVTTPHAIVLPYFIASGQHTLTDIPEAIGMACDDPSRLHDEVLVAGDVAVHYLEPVGAQPGCIDVILSRAREGGWRGQKSSIFAPSTPPPSHGVVRVLAHPHSHEIRHVDDLDAPEEELVTASTPLDLWWMLRQQRDHVRDAPRGYRAHPFALPMPSGWRLVTSTPEELVAALELVQPGVFATATRSPQHVDTLEGVLAKASGLYKKIVMLDKEKLELHVCTRCDRGCSLSRHWTMKTQTIQTDTRAYTTCITPCPTLLTELLEQVLREDA